MASQVFEVWKAGILDGTIDSVTTSANTLLRLMLVSTNTTADTDNDGIATIAGLGTLDQFDGDINSQAFSSQKNSDHHIKTVTCSVTESGTIKYLTASGTTTWTAVAAGTRAIQGVLLFKHTNDSGAVGADPEGVPVAFFDFSADVTPNGGNISVTFSSNRMISLT